MFKINIKFLIIVTSYVFLIFLIIISYNAVVPEKAYPVLENQNQIIEKVDNVYLPNENSINDILEKKKHMEQFNKKIDTERLDEKKNNSNPNMKFRVQLASFKDKQKSILISKKFKNKISSQVMGLDLIVKKKNINSKDIFYRIVSDKLFFYDEASLICKKIVEIKLQCIVVKENF